MSVGLARHHRQRNWGARLRVYALDGLPLVVLENELLRLAFLAGKGADLVEWLYKPRDLDLVWLSPNGVVAPAAAQPTAADPVASFIDAYPGGWQVVFPNGGAPSAAAGAHFGQHGEACLLPWEIRVVEDRPEAVAVAFSTRLRRTPFAVERSVRLAAGEAAFRLTETVVNESDVAVPAMWGQHVTFGPPFLDPTCRVRMPVGVEVRPHPAPIHPEGRRVAPGGPFPWPVVPGARGAIDLGQLPPPGAPSEIVYLSGFGETGSYTVEHPGRGLSVGVEWDARTQPTCWYWQEFGATSGWPWYGRAYVVGLEPFAGFPTDGLAAAVANGSALAFAAGETKRTWLRAEVRPLEPGEREPVPPGDDDRREADRAGRGSAGGRA